MCLKIIFRVLLVVVNIVIALIGFIFLAIGAVIKFADQIAGSQISDLLGEVGDITGSMGITDGSSAPLDTDQLVKDVMAFADDGALAFILVGVFIFALGIFGCCGGCCMFKVALIVYGVVALVFTLIMVIMVAMFFQGNFTDDVKTTVQDMIDDKFGGIDSWTPESILINFIQLKYECCGIDNWRDFNNATVWDRVRTFETELGFTVEKLLKTPISCCITTGDFPDVEPEDNECATIPHVLNNNMETGCYAEVSKDMDTYKTPLQAICILLILFVFLLAVAALYLFVDAICCIKKVSPI